MRRRACRLACSGDAERTRRLGVDAGTVLLGLVVAWSGAGVALGVAAFTRVLAAHPAKLVAVDSAAGAGWTGRGLHSDRDRRGGVLVAAVVAAIASAGWSWLVPVLVAGPLVAMELSFEIRSRGRGWCPSCVGRRCRCGLRFDRARGRWCRLAVGVWLVLAARAVGAIPFVRVQISDCAVAPGRCGRAMWLRRCRRNRRRWR